MERLNCPLYGTTLLAELLDLYWSNVEAEGLEEVDRLNRALALACRVNVSSKIVIKLMKMGADACYMHSDVPVIVLAIRTEKLAAVEYMLEMHPELINATVPVDTIVNKHKYEGVLELLFYASCTVLTLVRFSQILRLHLKRILHCSKRISKIT